LQGSANFLEENLKEALGKLPFPIRAELSEATATGQGPRHSAYTHNQVVIIQQISRCLARI